MSFGRKDSLRVLGNVKTIQYLGGKHTEYDYRTACAIIQNNLEIETDESKGFQYKKIRQ